MTTAAAITSTGNNSIDGMYSTWLKKFGQTSITFTFDDNTTLPSIYKTFGVTYTEMGATAKSVDREALAQISQFTLLQFTEVSKGSTSDLHIINHTQASQASYPYDFNNDGVIDAGSTDTGGVWIGGGGLYGATFAPLPSRWYEANPAFGDIGYTTNFHEFGHAMGLKHPHDTGGLGAVTTANDGLENSVMSYRSYLGSPIPNGSGGSYGSYGFDALDAPTSYMRDDIRALQSLYGANFGTGSNNTDTVYSWSSSTGQEFINGVGQGTPAKNHIFQTIWDGNGVDTYDFSNYTGAMTIDLRPGYSSLISTAQRVDLDKENTTGVHMAAGNVYNAYQYGSDVRSLIENAKGGSGNDDITGNDAQNEFTGNGGDDILRGGTAGNDIAVLHGVRSNYTITDTSIPDWLREQDNRGGSAVDGQDWNGSIGHYKLLGDGANYTDAHFRTGTSQTWSEVSNFSATHNSLVSMNSRISYDGNVASKLILWNVDADTHWRVNGVDQDYDVSIIVDPTDTIQLYTGDGSSHTFYTAAIDAYGTRGAWYAFTVTNTADGTPTGGAINANVTGTAAPMHLASLFSFSDDSGALQHYAVYSNMAHGHIWLDGNAIATSTYVQFTAAEFNRLEFLADNATGTTTISVNVGDGMTWIGSYQSTNVNMTAYSPTGGAPTMSGPNVSVAHGEVSASSLFTYADPNSDPAQMFNVVDIGNASGGHLSLYGNILSTNTYHLLTPQQVSDLKVVGNSASDTIWIQAFDGHGNWGSWDDVTITQPANNAPSVTGSSSFNITAGTSVAASTLFSASDADGDTLKFEFWDDNFSGDSGHFARDGVALHQDSAITVLAADLSHYSFVSALSAGTNDDLYFRAFDGTDWTAWHLATEHTI